MANEKFNAAEVQGILNGLTNNAKNNGETWDSLVSDQITQLSKRYSGDAKTNAILANWHKNITLDYKHNKGFSPHVNGFYMVFMVHGPWYSMYQDYVHGHNEAGLSELPDAKKASHGKLEQMDAFNLSNPNSNLNMLATDIDIPDITEEYTSVSSRLRNSFVPSRNYFVSDFNISYIENINLDIMRYHEAWHKFMQLIKRGEHIGTGITNFSGDKAQCRERNKGYFLDMPFSNAVWVAVFKPFTTEIQMIVKLMGVMPITMPLKQVIGNRSQSKMTVLNISYKAADIFYKFYNSTDEFLQDDNILAKSFRQEVFSTREGVSAQNEKTTYSGTPNGVPGNIG